MTAPIIDLAAHRLAGQLDEAIRRAAPLTSRPLPRPTPRQLPTPTRAAALVARWERRVDAAWRAVMAADLGELVRRLDEHDAAAVFLSAAHRCRTRALLEVAGLAWDGEVGSGG